MAERGIGRHNRLCRVSPPLGHTAKNTCSLQGHMETKAKAQIKKQKKRYFFFSSRKGETQLSKINSIPTRKGIPISYIESE